MSCGVEQYLNVQYFQFVRFLDRRTHNRRTAGAMFVCADVAQCIAMTTRQQVLNLCVGAKISEFIMYVVPVVHFFNSSCSSTGGQTDTERYVRLSCSCDPVYSNEHESALWCQIFHNSLCISLS